MAATKGRRDIRGPDGKGYDPPTPGDSEVQRQYIEILAGELNQIYRSRSWKLAQLIRKLARPGRLRWLATRARMTFLGLSSRRRRLKFQKAFPELAREKGVYLANQLGVQYTHHRSGWTFAVDTLSVLNKRNAPYLDVCVERTFARQIAPLATHADRWAGICHVPTCIPDWLPESLCHQFFPNYSRTPAWYCGVPNCIGLYALSETHAQELRKSTGLNVSTLFHPTEIPNLQWSMDRFLANGKKKALQIGWWLRRMHGIFQVRLPRFEKVLLELPGRRHIEEYFAREEEHLLRLGQFRMEMLETASRMPYVSNRVYDRLLSENIVFLDLYGSSANNAIVECIARGTPLLVNPLPAVVEYLGPSYPLYYSSYEEAEHKSSDMDLIHKAHESLQSPLTRKKITAENFLRTFMSSPIYQDNGAAN